MSTREAIIALADELIRERGYNAFSYHDLSRALGIKTASIHYHFPKKSDLGIAVVQDQLTKIQALKQQLADKSPLEKLEGFLSIYSKIRKENKVCLVGSLATDLHSVDEAVGEELKKLGKMILEWVTEILTEGKKKKVFRFFEDPRTKAMLIISSMLASVQLTRLTKQGDFSLIRNAIVKDLKS
jgi:AcrR family transcriptional regulator